MPRTEAALLCAAAGELDAAAGVLDAEVPGLPAGEAPADGVAAVVAAAVAAGLLVGVGVGPGPVMHAPLSMFKAPAQSDPMLNSTLFAGELEPRDRYATPSGDWYDTM